MRNVHRLSVRVNRETKAQLREICSVTKLTESEFIRQSIAAYLREAYGIILAAKEGE